MINMIHSGLSGPAGKKTRKKRSDPWAASAALFYILPADPDQPGDVRQVVQGTGSVPEPVLLPHPGGRRQEKEPVDERAGYGDAAAAA